MILCMEGGGIMHARAVAPTQLNSTLQILNFAFQRPVHCSALQFCVFYVHIFTLAALYFPFQQGKNLQI